jgi:hypothetical protein
MLERYLGGKSTEVLDPIHTGKRRRKRWGRR